MPMGAESSDDDDPTVRQKLAETHEIEVGYESESLELSILWIVHFVPFQNSASNGCEVPLDDDPEASQSVDDTQLTPVRYVSDPLGLGTFAGLQFEPFQISETARSAFDSPTATQLSVLAHETADSAAPPFTDGMSSVLQALPFQVETTGCSLSVLAR
jgi:hypothetical protein